MTPCLIGLGSNLGDRQLLLSSAIDACGKLPQTRCVDVSPYISTAPIGGPPQQGQFLNAAVLLETDLSLHDFFMQLQQIERNCGRERRQRWAARTIDLDILLFGDYCCSSHELTIPHPWMALRRFVLEPAVAIAPQMIHPQIGWSIRQLYHHLHSHEKYIAITGPDSALVRSLVVEIARQAGKYALLCDVASDVAGSLRRSGRTGEESLELLERRANRLRVVVGDRVPRSVPPDRSVPLPHTNLPLTDFWLTDFWLDDLLDDCLRAAPAIRQRAMHLWQSVRSLVPQPALVVVITPSRPARVDLSPTDAHAQATSSLADRIGAQANKRANQGAELDECELTSEAERRLRAIVARAARPGRGPLLVLDGSDPERVVHDVCAVFDAMA